MQFGWRLHRGQVVAARRVQSVQRWGFEHRRRIGFGEIQTVQQCRLHHLRHEQGEAFARTASNRMERGQL